MRHTLLNNDKSENFHQNSETCVCLRNNIIISTTREPSVSTRHDQSKALIAHGYQKHWCCGLYSYMVR